MESQKYKILSGTTSRGFDYEKKIAALVSLNCLLPENCIEDFWIATNIEDKLVGKFDDVVVCVKRRNVKKKQLYLLQLKHYEKRRKEKKLTYNAFASRDDMMLQKYADSVVATSRPDKKSIFADVDTKNITYVLYTNQTSGLDASLAGGFADEALFRTGGQMYKFPEYENVAKEFLDRLYVFTEQINEELLNDVIQERLSTFLALDALKVSKKFVEYIISWASGDRGNFRTITRKEIVLILAELLVAPLYHLEERFENVAVDNNSCQIWQWVVDNHRVVVIEDNHNLTTKEVNFIAKPIYEHIHKLVGGNLPVDRWAKPMSDDELSRIFTTVNQDDFTSAYGTENISPQDIHFFEWRLRHLPLILRVNDAPEIAAFIKSLTLVDDPIKSVLLFKPETQISIPPTISCFKCMSDLKIGLDFNSKNVLDSLLRSKLSVQGRNTSLGDILNADRCDVAKKELKVHHFIKLLCNSLMVGVETSTSLPEIYIDRTIEPICLVASILTDVTDCVFVVVETTEGDFDLFLKEQYLITGFMRVDRLLGTKIVTNPNDAKVVLMSSNDGHLDYKELSFGPKLADNVHVVQLHKKDGTFCFEWIRSRGNIGKLSTLRADNFLNLANHSNLLQYFERNAINLIAATPGMGKTTLLDYFCKICPPDFWIVRINCNEHITYISQDISDDPKANLLYFAKKTYGAGKLDEVIFNNYLENNKLWIMFDAFDEIVPLYTETATKLIRSISSFGFRTFVTTRLTTQTYLENQFGVLANSIGSFTVKDQESYFTKYFGRYVTNVEVNALQKFISDLLQKTTHNFLRCANEFLAIPLQMKMMAQIIRDKLRNVRDAVTENFLFESVEPIELMEQFIALKIELYWMDKLQNKDNALNRIAFEEYKTRSITNHMLCAANAFFTKQLPGAIFDDAKEFVREIQLGVEKTGLVERVDAHGNVVFVHQTIYEYFVALWMSQNVKDNKDLLLKLYEPKHTNIKATFDRILARNCPLHLAVLNNNEAEVKTLLETEAHVLSTDLGGRTALHLAASLGNKEFAKNVLYEDAQKTMRYENASIKDEIMQALLEKCGHLEQPDCILKFRPIDYAVKSFSLKNINRLLSQRVKLSPETQLDVAVKVEQLLTTCAAYDYDDLTKVLIDARPSINIADVTVNNLRQTLLHIAARCGSTRTIEILSKLIPIDALDDCQQTALHLAAQYGHSNVIKLLVDAGASVNQADALKCTPIQLAARFGNYEAFAALSNAHATVDPALIEEIATSGKDTGKWEHFSDKVHDFFNDGKVEKQYEAEYTRVEDSVKAEVARWGDQVAEVLSPRTEENIKREVKEAGNKIKNVFRKLF